MTEKLILSLIITVLFQLQVAFQSETPRSKVSVLQQMPNNSLIAEIAKENLGDVLRWLKQKKTMLN